MTERLSLAHMPHEVWAGIVSDLTISDFGRLAPCGKFVSEEASDPELWFHFFMRSCWPPSPALLAFAEGGIRTASSIDWLQRLRARANAPPAIVVDCGRGYSKYSVVHGIHGRADGMPPRMVQLCSSPTHPPDCEHGEDLQFIEEQLDEALERAAADPEDELHFAALAPNKPLVVGGLALCRGLQARPEMNGCVVRLLTYHEDRGRWATERSDASPPVRRPFSARIWRPAGDDAGNESNQMLLKSANLVPVRRAQDMPILIGEPFTLTASRARGRGGAGSAASWTQNVHMQLGTDRTGPVHIVSQAQMSLWAHGIDHGIVVNIGQGQTVAVPVVRGQVMAETSRVADVGSRDLTSCMVRLLSSRYNNVDGSLMTWCRDMKEQHCYVAPPSARSGQAISLRSAPTNDFGAPGVVVDVPARPGREQTTVEISRERVMVPELLFEEGLGHPSLPYLIAACAVQTFENGHCDQDGLRDLLRQIVLVGGAADFPGMRPRVEFEVRDLIRNRCGRLRALVESPDDVFVLNPPLGDDGVLTTPRFVPLIGGCVRAASSGGYAEWSIQEEQAEDREGPAQPPWMAGLVRIPGMQAWMERRGMNMNLNGPAIFRTGGGGGEDDEVWRDLLGSANSPEDEDEESRPEDEDEESSGEGEESADASGI